jgi:hypothetical protein
MRPAAPTVPDAKISVPDSLAAVRVVHAREELVAARAARAFLRR